MSNFGGLTFTTKGRNLQAKAEAGAALQFTKIKIGSGYLGGQSIATLADLVTTVKTLSITKCKSLANGSAVVGTSFNNSEQTTGFYWREIGLFATDPDLGEILYCYGNAGDDAEYIPAAGGTDIVEKSVDIVALIGNATSVSAVIDASLVFALQSDLDDEVSARAAADTIRPTMTTADLTFYVNASAGSDSNTGLTSVTAFKTIQKAIDSIPQVVNHTAIINVAAGTYAEDVSIKGFVGKGGINLYGDTVVSTNYTVNSITVLNCHLTVNIRGFNIITTTTDGILASKISNMSIMYCKIIGVTATYSGIYIANGFAAITNCVLSNKYYGIRAQAAAKVYTQLNSGTGNTYGLYAAVSAIIMKDGTLQPYGTTPKLVANGGSICGAGGMVDRTNYDLTYYVNASTGSDSNDGLSSSTAFKTIQRAIDVLPQIVNHTVTINVAAGTYNEDVGIRGFAGSGVIYLYGDTVVSTSYNVNSILVAYCVCSVNIRGFNALTTVGTGFYFSRCMYVAMTYCNCVGASATYAGVSTVSTYASVSNCNFSNRNYAISAAHGSRLSVFTNTGSGNTVGLLSGYASIIIRYGTQSSATTAETKDLGIITDAYGIPTEVNPMKIGTALPATTGTMTATMDGSVKTITPTGACTFNASGGFVGQRCSFVITTSGTTSYTLTFGTNFKTTGTLATGTTTGKKYVINFVYDGTYWNEAGRTAAM